MDMNTPEVIVRVGAEGGSITLFGQKDSQGAWLFSRAINDQTPTFLSDEDGGGPAIDDTSAWVNSWPAALALLDQYPWAMLYGQEVHPEFRDRVWAEVNQRLQGADAEHAERARECWARACCVRLGATFPLF